MAIVKKTCFIYVNMIVGEVYNYSKLLTKLKQILPVSEKLVEEGCK